LGAALGTACGLLLAPRNGRETRRVLQNSLDSVPNLTGDAADGFQVQANQFLQQARRQVDQTLVRLQEALTAGKKASVAYVSTENGHSPAAPPLTPGE